MPVLTKINTNSIAEDAITGDKFAGDAYLANTANQNISGTYSENRLYTSDAYTLSGNATVNSHLTLSSVKPTGDVVLTAGGAYTITGTGVLSGGSLVAKVNTDLTGMTGEVGSVVTGSPNLNLGNATFPAGHVLQTKTRTTESNASTGNYTQTMSTSWATIDLGGELLYSGFTATNGNTLVFTLGGFAGRCTPKDQTYRVELSLWKGNTNIGGMNRFVGGTADYRIPLDFVLVIENCQSFSNETITAKAKREVGGGFTGTHWLNANGNHSSGATYGGPRLPFLMIQEIQA